MEENKYPEISVGAFIQNTKGEIFLIRSPKWGGRLIGPGGHIEYGETAEKALQREVREETGLEIKNLEFLSVAELPESPEFTKREAHFICLDYRAELVNDDQEVKLNDEASEYFWLKPEEIVKRDDVEATTKIAINKFFISKNIDCKNCVDYKAGWQRAQADYQNLKKEIENMRGEWARYSEQQILEEFIPVYDNFKKAFTTEHSEDNWAKGIGYIMKQMEKVLKDHGVEEIKTIGELFNPELHEAVGEEESSQPEHTIIREVEAGYTMKGKVIKVAKVIVSK